MSNFQIEFLSYRSNAVSVYDASKPSLHCVHLLFGATRMIRSSIMRWLTYLDLCLCLVSSSVHWFCSLSSSVSCLERKMLLAFYKNIKIVNPLTYIISFFAFIIAHFCRMNIFLSVVHSDCLCEIIS